MFKLESEQKMSVKNKKIGKQTIKLENPPKIISTYSIVGPKEGEGPLGGYFHKILDDDTLGQDSFEKAESEMMYTAIKSAIIFRWWIWKLCYSIYIISF